MWNVNAWYILRVFQYNLNVFELTQVIMSYQRHDSISNSEIDEFVWKVFKGVVNNTHIECESCSSETSSVVMSWNDEIINMRNDENCWCENYIICVCNVDSALLMARTSLHKYVCGIILCYRLI